ncbi:MAG: hypothetical protein LW850_08430 [Planctomycetaceae bacterium]|nr:hypothetical protein [Planctomycetaceae bacterium]
MSQAEDSKVVLRMQKIDVVRFIGVVLFAIAIKSELFTLINNRQLDRRISCVGFNLTGKWVLLGTSKVVTSCHPFAINPLAINDPVKLITSLDRKRAAATLHKIRGRDPSNQGFVAGLAAHGFIGEERHD